MILMNGSSLTGLALKALRLWLLNFIFLSWNKLQKSKALNRTKSKQGEKVEKFNAERANKPQAKKFWDYKENK
jgi:fatty acid desaturase